MKCDRCGIEIKEGEEMNRHGQVLCEDCYMDALSPTRVCDPWAVHTAKSCLPADGSAPELTDRQSLILKILEETGGIEPDALASELGIKRSELEKDVAALRHMEKLRGERRGDKTFLILW